MYIYINKKKKTQKLMLDSHMLHYITLFLENQIEYYASISHTVIRPPLPKSETTLDLVHWERQNSHWERLTPQRRITVMTILPGFLREMQKTLLPRSLTLSIACSRVKYTLVCGNLLWHCGKVAELSVVSRLWNTTKRLLTEDQYAYSEGVGCTEALIDMISSWTKTLDQRSNLSLFVNFSKAFDMMDPAILEKKVFVDKSRS